MAVEQSTIDPITLEIQWQRLIAIMDEVDNAVVRTSFSTIVGESRDFAVIMTDHRGASLCQSSFSPPNFCVVLPRTSRHVLARFPIETLHEGDVLITNDAWLGTGHLPDYVVLTPIFWMGKVVAFTGIVAHLADVGGHAGDIEAVDVFMEGLRLTPCKLYEAGQENQLLFEIIGNNCRMPELVLGDLRAIAGAATMAARRVHEFMEDYGLNDLVELSETIHNRSEEAIRARIAELPDGVYEFGLDIDGYIDPVHLHATITISGSDVYVDYTGSSPQTRKAAINCTFNTTFASTMYPFKCALVPDIPNNEGLFRPIHVSAPAGSILNCTFPAPVKARAKTTNNMNQVLFGALWSIFGDHAQAGSGSIWPFKFFGEEPGYGRFGVHCLPHGGRGSMRNLDGMVPIAFPHNSSVTPSEILELRAPILIEKKELRPDSAGPGRRRGGLGQEIVVRSIATKPMTMLLRPDKMFFNPPGLGGGQPGAVGHVFVNGEEITRFPALQFNPGDELRLLMPGGGGFGPVEQREPELIVRDLNLAYITPEAAPRDYGYTSADTTQEAPNPTQG